MNTDPFEMLSSTHDESQRAGDVLRFARRSDELGFAWDDPTAAVPWPAVTATPDGHPILSERDRTNPSLPELVARLRKSIREAAAQAKKEGMI